MKKAMNVLGVAFLGAALAVPAFADQTVTKNVEVLNDADKAEAGKMVDLQYCLNSGLNMMAGLMMLAQGDESVKKDLEKAVASLQTKCEEDTGYTVQRGLVFQQQMVEKYGTREKALEVIGNTLQPK